MTLSSHSNSPLSHHQSGRQRQSGIVAVEMAFIVTALILIFAFSLQLGRQFYWQQHFNNAADRFAKLLVLDIQTSRKVNSASFDNALAILQNQVSPNDFDIGLSIHILSDDLTKEESFDIGSGCNKNSDFVTKMEQLVAKEAVDAVQRKAIPVRYILGLSLCAQPQNWIDIHYFTGLGELPLLSQSYYPINHKAF